MSEEKFAVLADIHGNVWALESVLADIDRRGLTDTYDLGDSLYGPLEPAATADLLIGRAIPSIRGNCDRMLVEAVPAARPTVARLTPAHLAWVAALPPTRVVGGDALVCHGTPASDETYLLEVPTSGGGQLRAPDAIAGDLAGVGQALVCCGHSHVPRVVQLPGGLLVVNPGSVGLAAYEQDQPAPHVMESGTPHAKYAILTRRGEAWAIELVQVPYDWAKAAACAAAAGRADWARALATGWAR